MNGFSDNQALAYVPITMSGYGVEQDNSKSDGSKRCYYIADRLIAEAQVMFYEGNLGLDPAGFLFAGKLYKKSRELDQAVSELASALLLAKWKE